MYKIIYYNNSYFIIQNYQHLNRVEDRVFQMMLINQQKTEFHPDYNQYKK